MLFIATIRQLLLHSVNRHVLRRSGTQLVDAVVTLDAAVVQRYSVEFRRLGNTRQVHSVCADKFPNRNAVIRTVVPVVCKLRNTGYNRDILQIGDICVRDRIDGLLNLCQLRDVERDTAVSITEFSRNVDGVLTVQILFDPRVARDSLCVKYNAV